MAFAQFMAWTWPEDSMRMLRASILDVQAFKDHMVMHGGAPKTINRRISSLSSFYKFLIGAAAKLRLPITVPNPAHAQFIARESSDPVDETRALSETRARQLVAMPEGESILELRDRAILKLCLLESPSGRRSTDSDSRSECHARRQFVCADAWLRSSTVHVERRRQGTECDGRDFH